MTISIQILHTDGSPATIETGLEALLATDPATIDLVRLRHRSLSALGNGTRMQNITAIHPLVEPFDGRLVIEYTDPERARADEQVVDTTVCNVVAVRVVGPQDAVSPITAAESRALLTVPEGQVEVTLRETLQRIEYLIDHASDETTAAREMNIAARRALAHHHKLQPKVLTGHKPSKDLDMFAVLNAVELGKSIQPSLSRVLRDESDSDLLVQVRQTLLEAMVRCLTEVVLVTGRHLVAVERAKRD